MSCRTTQHLANEHREIESILSAFENFLTHIADEQGGERRRELWGLLDNLTENLFLKHEEKEEVVLMPELLRSGLSWSNAILSHVRTEHRQGRYLLRSLRQACHQVPSWTEKNRQHFLSVSREWVKFMRHHMEQEETRLFPLLDTNLEQEDDERIVNEFERIDLDFEEMLDADFFREGKEAFLQKYEAA